jgi:hypothetical protein
MIEGVIVEGERLPSRNQPQTLDCKLPNRSQYAVRSRRSTLKPYQNFCREPRDPQKKSCLNLLNLRIMNLTKPQT